MSIDNLFRQLKDIQFQADKILKSKKIEEEAIERFANYSNSLKSNLIDLQLNEELAIHVEDIETIDPQFGPKLPVLTTIIGALSFGVATKKYRAKKRESYFRSKVKNTKEQFAHIDFLLKEI